jgi:menaquinone-specific isochorismate synthase
MADFPPEGFVCEYAPGRLVMGSGPLERRAARRPDRPACYAPDFFLDDPLPWLHADRWHECSREELAELIPRSPRPAVAWTPLSPDAYGRVYAQLVAAIARGPLTKAVPVVLERGRLTDDAPLAPALLAALLDAPDASLLYGLWNASEGIVGASPEILFRRLENGGVETAAVAGTYPAARGACLADDPKEAAEHQSVVDDIAGVLAPLGRVEIGPRELLCLPLLAHLKTELFLSPARPVGFSDLVRALHPTAALGAAPRDADPGLLRRLDADGTAGRQRLGAPFGVEWPDGRAACLVAIRNVQWHGRDLILGAGGGVIAQSRLDAEWEELRLKREAVKRMFTL